MTYDRPVRSGRRIVPALYLLAVIVAAAAGQATAARAPSYLERVTIMDAFNTPGRSLASRCVRIYVSTVDARYAKLVSPARPVPACVKAGEVGDGYALFRRTSRRSLRWRDFYEASDLPCGRLPSPVMSDLFPAAHC
jgi:hypothetical protein